MLATLDDEISKAMLSSSLSDAIAVAMEQGSAQLCVYFLNFF
jgi:hypothetical protein